MKRKIAMLVFIVFANIVVHGQCSITTANPTHTFYPGTTYNLPTNYSVVPLYYLCNNSTVYDTTVFGERDSYISSGAKFNWRRCYGAASNAWIKSGGTLNIIPGGCGGTMILYLEPGAIVLDPASSLTVSAITYTCSSIVFPAVNCSTGINDQDANPGFIRLFPNPVSSKLNVEVSFNCTMSIRSVLGDLVISETLKPEERCVDFLNLAAGIYVVQFITDKSIIYSSKIIKE